MNKVVAVQVSDTTMLNQGTNVRPKNLTPTSEKKSGQALSKGEGTRRGAILFQNHFIIQNQSSLQSPQVPPSGGGGG